MTLPKAVACGAWWKPTSSGSARGAEGESTTSATTTSSSRKTV
ncbi:hypothetical protein ACIP4Y_36575 [Streptomyces sp. NPDC088810]